MRKIKNRGKKTNFEIQVTDCKWEHIANVETVIVKLLSFNSLNMLFKRNCHCIKFEEFVLIREKGVNNCNKK